MELRPADRFPLGKRHTDNTGPDYTYTAAGRLLTRTWARTVGGQPLVTTYTNNAAGELLRITYSDSTPTVEFTYDLRGRRTHVTTGTNTAVSTFNDAGQLLTESFPFAGLTVTNGYDTLYRRQSRTGVSPVGFAYDAASRLYTVSAGTLTATYAYTQHLPGLVSNITFSAGGTNRLTTTKTYDNLNRLTEILTQDSGLRTLDSHSYAYNSANQRTQRTDADGSYWHYGYDSLGQVTNAVRRWSDNAPVSGQQYGYQFDDIGNRQRSAVSGQRSYYSGNLLNQYESRSVPGFVNVTGLASNAATVSVGNVRATRQGDHFHAAVPLSNTTSAVYTSLVTMGVLKNAGPNGADIVASKTGTVFVAQSPEPFTHDADGNVISDGRWAYTWDAENRLIAVESLTNAPAASRRKVEWTYDGQGRRIRQKVYAWNTDLWTLTSDLLFLYDGWQCVAELNATNNAVFRSYVWGLDMSGSSTGAGGVGGLLFGTFNDLSSSSVVSYAFDGNGNVAALVDMQTGQVAASYEYGPFGEAIRASGPLAKENPFRFSTKRTDETTGLVLYEYRAYSSVTGRWLSPDPLGETGGLNLYGMVGNDPVDELDPFGFTNQPGDQGWNPYQQYVPALNPPARYFWSYRPPKPSPPRCYFQCDDRLKSFNTR